MSKVSFPHSVSSNKTDHQDISELLLKVALNSNFYKFIRPFHNDISTLTKNNIISMLRTDLLKQMHFYSDIINNLESDGN